MAREICMLLFLFSFAVYEGLALRCWDCTSNVNSFCGDPFNSSRVSPTDCDRHQSFNQYSGHISVCKKQKQMIGSSLTILRSCHWVNQYEAVSGNCPYSGPKPEHIQDTFCEICTTDYCNSAPKLISTSTVILTSIFWRFAPKLLF